MNRRRILKRFRLSEISGVDKPAQEHALALIEKAHTPESPMTKTEAEDRIEELAQQRIAKSGEDYLDSYVAVCHEHPELYAAASGPVVSDELAKAAARRDAAHAELTKRAHERKLLDNVSFADAYVAECEADRQLADEAIG